MNPNDYTTETGRLTAKCVRAVRDKAREAVKVADALESFAEEMCDRFELEAEALRKRIAELERETADRTESIASDAESVDAWEELCTALGVKRRGIVDVTQAVYGLQAALRAAKSPAIPVAELAEVLGCDADAYTVRNLVAENHLQASRRAQGLDTPQPDADGWYEHDGKSWPACLPSDEVEFEDQDGDRMVRKADLVFWVKQDFRPVRWRYADGRDTQTEDGGEA